MKHVRICSDATRPCRSLPSPSAAEPSSQYEIARGAQHADLRHDPELVRTRRVHPSQELLPIAHGGVRMTMMIGDLTELATWILGFGETARVVEPKDLVDRVTKELTGALALYGRKVVEGG